MLNRMGRAPRKGDGKGAPAGEPTDRGRCSGAGCSSPFLSKDTDGRGVLVAHVVDGPVGKDAAHVPAAGKAATV